MLSRPGPFSVIDPAFPRSVKTEIERTLDTELTSIARQTSGMGGGSYLVGSGDRRWIARVQPSSTSRLQKSLVAQKKAEPRVKKNFRAPYPGEPNAGWTDDCLFYYQLYGRTPPICGKYGRSFMTWD